MALNDITQTISDMYRFMLGVQIYEYEGNVDSKYSEDEVMAFDEWIRNRDLKLYNEAHKTVDRLKQKYGW